MRVLMSVLPAPSTLNQAEMIKKLIESKGFEVEYRKTITTHEAELDDVHALLWFQLATINFLGDAIVPYLFVDKPKAVYVTIEGVPTRANTIHSNLPRLQFITVSQFAADCLKKAGLKVIDVVHHAIDFDLVKQAKPYAEQYRREWEQKYKDKVKLLYVGRNDPRKGLDKLSAAVDIVNDLKPDGWVLLMHSETSATELLNKKNVEFVGTFGTLKYQQVLGMMGAADYVIFPTKSEGFGLPVLEANAMGKPVIHCWIPPLTEFSSEVFNFVFPYEDRQLVNQGGVQYWIFHEYNPAVLADVMLYAIDTFRESREEYEEYCQQAKEHAKKWSYKKVYPRLLKHINIE